MITGFLALIMSPLGKRITAAAVLLIVLGFAYRSCAKSIEKAGIEKGYRQAMTELQKVNETNWAEMRNIIETQRVAAADQIAAVRKSQASFVKKQTQVETVVAEHQSEADAKHEAIREEVEAAIPNTPEPVIEELAIYREEVAELRSDIKELTTLLGEAETIRTQMDEAHAAQVSNLQAQVEQLRVERDFYKTAFEGSAPKKGRGFWKKVGCGLATVGTLGIAGCKP